jgi:ribonuclease HI
VAGVTKHRTARSIKCVDNVLRRIKKSPRRRSRSILISPQGDKLKYVLRMSFPQASNKEAEYEALLHGMKIAKACGAT